MKKYIIILFSSLMLLGVFSCKNSFLDETPYASYTPITLTDSLGFEASLVGLYNHVSTIFTWSDQQGWVSVWQVGTDVANATANQQAIEIPYYNYTLLTPADAAASQIWNRYYILINLSNTIIDNLSKSTLSQGGKNIDAAEAKFFRAYAYEHLANLFGKVPLVRHALTGPKTDFVRAPLDSINDFIVSDLTFAAANLPDIEKVRTNSKGKMYERANKYMAMQLLAEAYLRMNQPALAEVQTQAIISSGKFSLIKARYGVKSSSPGDYYSDMFYYGNQRRAQGNTEAIWVLEQENTTVVVGGATNAAQQRRVWGAAYYNLSGMAICDSLGGRGIGRLRLSNWVIYKLYAKNDIRNSKYNLRRRFWYNDVSKPATYGKPVPYTGPDTLYKICPYITKWGAFDPNDTFGWVMFKDYILMRFGETYLLQAEAQFKQGHLVDAANSINELRKRAFANYPAEGQVQASDITLNFILDERARELIGEENRRATLMRTGTLVDRAMTLNGNDKVHPTVGLSATHLLLPIPLSEIQLNKDATLEQNPGY
jgi:starch-binding outer membrane protein, SusD/RagB family